MINAISAADLNTEYLLSGTKVPIEVFCYQKGYNQGRLDRYDEISSFYQLMTREELENIRREAIEDYRNALHRQIADNGNRFGFNNPELVNLNSDEIDCIALAVLSNQKEV